MKIIEPKTVREFEEYYHLRWEVLRAPWNKPQGSEKDDLEHESIHAMAIDDSGGAVGVVRLNFTGQQQGQIRYMGVKADFAGKGIGSRLLGYIEKKAQMAGIASVFLHSRENAVAFYKKNGYAIIEKSYLMWGEIQHYLMKKSI